MKIKLLNAGGYLALDNIKFPAYFNEYKVVYNGIDYAVKIKGSDLIRSGARTTALKPDGEYMFFKDEFEFSS